MNISHCKEHPKKQDNVARRKIVKEEGSGNSSTDSGGC
jgi:hypothetical protein